MIALLLALASSPASADPWTPPILPLQGPQVIGLLSIPVFSLGMDVNQPGAYRLTAPLEATGTSEVVLGVFRAPDPFLIATAGSANHRFSRGNAKLVYEVAIVPPPELGCAFPVWSIRDDLGFEVFSDGISIRLTDDGDFNDVFGGSQLLTLEANHAYRVTMQIDAEAKASTQSAGATALVGSTFTFAPGVPAGYSFQFSAGIGNTGTPVPEPGFLASLGAGVMAIGLRGRRRRRRRGRVREVCPHDAASKIRGGGSPFIE